MLMKTLNSILRYFNLAYSDIENTGNIQIIYLPYDDVILSRLKSIMKSRKWVFESSMLSKYLILEHKQYMIVGLDFSNDYYIILKATPFI